MPSTSPNTSRPSHSTRHSTNAHKITSQWAYKFSTQVSLLIMPVNIQTLPLQALQANDQHWFLHRHRRRSQDYLLWGWGWLEEMFIPFRLRYKRISLSQNRLAESHIFRVNESLNVYKPRTQTLETTALYLIVVDAEFLAESGHDTRRCKQAVW